MKYISKILLVLCLIFLTSCSRIVPVNILGINSYGEKAVDMPTEVCKMVSKSEFNKIFPDSDQWNRIYTFGDLYLVLYKDIYNPAVKLTCDKEVKLKKEAEINAQKELEEKKKLEEENKLKAEQEAYEEQKKLEEEELEKEKVAVNTVQKAPVKKIIVPIVETQKAPVITPPIEEEVIIVPEEPKDEKLISDEASI